MVLANEFEFSTNTHASKNPREFRNVEMPFKYRVVSVQFGSVFRMEQFERFRFSVPTALPRKEVPMCFCAVLRGKHGSGFDSWQTVPAVPVPVSLPGKTVLTVPVSCLGSVPEPPCK